MNDEKSRRPRYQWYSGGKDFRPLADARGDNEKARSAPLTVEEWAVPAKWANHSRRACKGRDVLAGLDAVDHHDSGVDQTLIVPSHTEFL